MKGIKVSVQEINALYEKLSDIFKKNYNIVRDFIAQRYSIYEFHDLYFDKPKDLKINVVFLDENRNANYLQNDAIVSAIYEEDGEVLKAYCTIKEIKKIKTTLKIIDNNEKKHKVSLLQHIVKDDSRNVDVFSPSLSYVTKSYCICTEKCDVIDKDLILKSTYGMVTIKNYTDYYKLKNYVDFYDYNHRENLFFDCNGRLWKHLRNASLEEYDLKKVDFTNKNIAGIDITHNREVYINFDKLVKDLSDANISGYNLNEYKFVGWNLSNTDLRNTSATIDILSCNITTGGKMNMGTLFDEDNKFILGDKPISHEEVEKMGIKIYRK